MSNPKINQPTDGECGYIAFYSGRQAEVWADSSLKATELARTYFKPPKSKKYMVHVVLCEKNGKQITHTPDF